jgi:hypothetical protein
VRFQEGSIFESGATQKRAEQLSALRDQRMLLARVSDGVGIALHTFRMMPGGVNWRSAAQRSYSDRRTELQMELETLRRALDEALVGVQAAIAALSAAE